MQRSVVRSVGIAACLALAQQLWFCGLVRAADPTGLGAPVPRQVNVTADSAPGWIPSTELEQAARDTALAYLAAKDGGRAAQAYAMLAQGLKAMLPYAAYAQELDRFNGVAGGVVERRIVTITWTKDPPQGPAPGVYAALDLIGRFANVDRHCGFLILYQAPAGGPFQIAREEVNYLSNATAKAIEQSKSKAQLAAIWAETSARCPNYPQETPAPAPIPEAQASTIGYPTVDAALADLHSRPAVVFSSQQGWTVAEEVADDRASMTLWSFPPQGNPAYPSAVKRRMARTADGAWTLHMDVLCGATKAACDDLVRSFEQLNARMRADLTKQQTGRQ